MAGAAVQAVSSRRLAQIGRAAAAAAGDDALIDNRSGGINCETRVDRAVLADMDDAGRDCVGLGGEGRRTRVMQRARRMESVGKAQCSSVHWRAVMRMIN